MWLECGHAYTQKSWDRDWQLRADTWKPTKLHKHPIEIHKETSEATGLQRTREATGPRRHEDSELLGTPKPSSGVLAFFYHHFVFGLIYILWLVFFKLSIIVCGFNLCFLMRDNSHQGLCLSTQEGGWPWGSYWPWRTRVGLFTACGDVWTAPMGALTWSSKTIDVRACVCVGPPREVGGVFLGTNPQKPGKPGMVD